VNRFKTLWNFLSGSIQDFSMESRTYHLTSLMALLVLLGFTVVNAALGLWKVMLLAVICFLIKFLCYYLSRFHGKFRVAVIGSGILSYLALIFNYFINSGINGPTLFIFFFTFNFLVIVTPGRLRYVWVMMHTGIVAILLYLENSIPGIVKSAYSSAAWRAYDIYFTYLITLAFIYYVSIHLRKQYDYEKKLADVRFTSLIEKSKIVAHQETNLRQKNAVLGKIAFIQSHELRAPVSSIMGLIHILKESDFKDPEECILLIDRAVNEMDEKIRLIVKQTEEIGPES
jgi:signal transduction histidine kinase